MAISRSNINVALLITMSILTVLLAARFGRGEIGWQPMVAGMLFMISVDMEERSRWLFVASGFGLLFWHLVVR